tara:strand:- start:339 stop:800 length:462 start_codon:yes stop_codon:yes gene_type:complete
MIRDYLKYWIYKRKATNQYGVHSPYLSELIKFCFYNSEFKKIKKNPWNLSHQRLMTEYIFKKLNMFNEKIANEFKIEKIKIINTKDKVLNLSLSEIKKEKKSFLILIDNIHLDREIWDSFVLRSEYVILDLYFFGIIIQRPQQGKQLFLLKIF